MRIPFADHAARLAGFVTRAPHIIEEIEARLLNVQGKDLSRSPDPHRIEETLNTCFGESRADREVPAAVIDELRLTCAEIVEGL